MVKWATGFWSHDCPDDHWQPAFRQWFFFIYVEIGNAADKRDRPPSDEENATEETRYVGGSPGQPFKGVNRPLETIESPRTLTRLRTGAGSCESRAYASANWKAHSSRELLVIAPQSEYISHPYRHFFSIRDPQAVQKCADGAAHAHSRGACAQLYSRTWRLAACKLLIKSSQVIKTKFSDRPTGEPRAKGDKKGWWKLHRLRTALGSRCKKGMNNRVVCFFFLSICDELSYEF